MNKEEILSLSEEEINLRIAKFMGLDVENVSSTDKPLYMYEVVDEYGGKGYCEIPNYCHRLNCVYEVEERLFSLLDISNRSRGEYLNALGQFMDEGHTITDLIHASPIDRLRAALMVLEVKE